MALIDDFLLNKYKDPEMSRFQKTNLFFETNTFMTTQDPSIIAFRLMFDFNTSPLLTIDETNKNTAHSYLLSINELERAAYLKHFVQVLRFITDEMSWYFQSIDGLDGIWKRDFTNPAVSADLTIGCLDDVTFKITGLIDLYRKACFDWENTREVVPGNLRKFNMGVYVFNSTFVGDPYPKNPFGEFTGKNVKSKFNDVKGADFGKAAKGIWSKITGPNDKQSSMENTTRMLFTLGKCSIDLESGSSIFASLSNTAMTTGAQSIKINTKSIVEENVYMIFGNEKIADIVTGGLDIAAFDKPDDSNLGDFIADKVTGIATSLARGFIGEKVDAAKVGVASMILNAIGGESVSLNNDTRKITGGNTYQDSSLNNDTTTAGGNNTEGPSLANRTTNAAGNAYQDSSLNNDTTTASGNNTSGASLNNDTTTASGNNIDGPSLNNDTNPDVSPKTVYP